MTAIVQRKRVLLTRPTEVCIAGIGLRNFVGEADMDHWLMLRERAFARQKVGVGRWTRADFRREFLEKPWWRPDWMWFAEVEERNRTQTIGTVTMALRRGATTTVPVVHWLCVLPSWRRRGVARLLMSTLEVAAWDADYRQVALETHEAWREAAALYDAMGYEVVSR
jgi:GNAT superfamily N-acetyltransferase